VSNYEEDSGTVIPVTALRGAGTVRDIELGKDVKFSNLQSVAAVLGLRLELVEQLATD
jgi:hypothetical protein